MATSLLRSPRFQGISPVLCVHFSWTLAGCLRPPEIAFFIYLFGVLHRFMNRGLRGGRRECYYSATVAPLR